MKQIKSRIFQAIQSGKKFDCEASLKSYLSQSTHQQKENVELSVLLKQIDRLCIILNANDISGTGKLELLADDEANIFASKGDKNDASFLSQLQATEKILTKPYSHLLKLQKK